MPVNLDVLRMKLGERARQLLMTSRSLLAVAVLLTAALSGGFASQAFAAVQSFDAVADAQLSILAPKTANGTDVKMAVCGNGTPVCTADGVNEKRAVVKFNVTGISTAVTNAKLRFYISTKPVPAMQIKQMTTTNWEESNATWNSLATQPTTAATYTSPAGSNIGWYEADVTSAVSGNGTVSFMFISPSDLTTRLATRETSTKPQLVVTAQDPPPPPIDVCPNLPGDQPLGTDCNPPPADVCPELPGDQPVGTDCTPPPPTDVCPELPGDQPAGTDCTPPEPDACPELPGNQPVGSDCTPPSPVDVCPELPGDQPTGTDCNPPPTDVCPELPGNQPLGTDCTPPPIDVCPNLPGDQPLGTDCNPPPADVCPELPGDQPVGTDCTPPPTDDCPDIPGDQPVGTDCTPPPPPVVPMNIYFGTTHAHTGAFNDHGTDTSTPAQVFATAKAYGFNFIFLTEHSGPTGPANGPTFYADAKAQAAYYSENDKFIGMAGYEYSENGSDGDTDTGHMTGWGTDQFINAAAPGINFNAFFNLLVGERATKPVFAGFNHPDSGTGHNASTPTLLTPERRELVVMSEMTHKMEFITAEEAAFYKSYIIELDRGWRVAPTCGLDTHGLTNLKQAESSTKKPCRTGILATTLTNNSLVDAFQQRRIYSSRDTNLRLSYKVNGAWLGSQVGTPTNATFDITVSDPDTTTASDKITKVDIIGSGGVVLATQTFSDYNVSWQPTIPVGTNKYMFARVYNGERTTHTAVGAPVWFE